MGYAEDSFFTLGMGGRIGLVILSGVLMILCVWLVWTCVKGWGRVWRVVFALGVFWGFLWLSPQVYYAYFWLIFERPYPSRSWCVRRPASARWCGCLASRAKSAWRSMGRGCLPGC